MNDTTLLTQFARDGSADAFRELVARHTSLVYACALQRLRDAHAAQDVTQAVWIALALKAKDLRPDTPLPGWLYKATRFACGKYQRGEQRRKEREMRAFEQHQTDTDAASARQWDQLAPHLQVALDALSSADREVVLMRFYGKSSHRQIGECLNLSEDAAEKRVSRALDKLRRFFGGRGVTLTGTALGGLLMAHAAPAAPGSLVTMAGTAALAGAGGALAATETLMLAKGALKAMFIAKVKTVSLAAAACLVVAGTGVVVAKQVTGTAMPVAAPVVNQPTPIQMAQNNPPATAPVTPPASAGTETKPPTVQPKVEPGVFTLRVTRDGLMQSAPFTLIIPVKITAVEHAPNGATDVPKVGERIGICVPHSIENQKLLSGNCRVNLVRQRIAFNNNPKLDHWQYRFPNDFPDTNIGDCQKVKAPIGNPANDPNVRPLVRVEDPASGMVVRASDSINSFSIAAYAKDGKMIWQVKLPRRAEGLTIANGKVFVQPDGSAYDLQTGTAQGKLR